MAGETPQGGARWDDSLAELERVAHEYADAARKAERARIAKYVEEECIYLVGKLQAKEIARQIREQTP